MNPNRRKKLSKFLSYVLRHHPEEINLDVNRHGWANLDELIEKAKSEDRDLDRDSIKEIMVKSEKNRFILSEDGNYIRAGYGHSIEVDLQLSPKTPPDLLFHGTAKQNVSPILEEGIRPVNRNFVHLSTTRGEAKNVGSRHGHPVILEIQAKQMHMDGYDFYQSESEKGIWLVSFVPVGFINQHNM